VSNSLAPKATQSHRHNFDDLPYRMAKADLIKVAEEAARTRFGQILRRSVELAGLIEKDAADQLGVERAQFSRWLNGKENAQTWRWNEHEILGPSLIAAIAEVTPGAVIRTVIELQRKVG